MPNGIGPLPQSSPIEEGGTRFAHRDWLRWLGTIKALLDLVHIGTGSPESVVPAPVGAVYLRLDGGAGSTIYIKESGTADTGWIGK